MKKMFGKKQQHDLRPDAQFLFHFVDILDIRHGDKGSTQEKKTSDKVWFMRVLLKRQFLVPYYENNLNL